MVTLPSLKQLRYLLALSEHLSFTRAAEACFVTQSTLSAGLKELEAQLGVRLVERNRQTVLMTPAGLEAVRRAHSLLAAAQDLVEVVAGTGEAMTGLLHLGVIPTIAPFLLPAALPEIRARHPKLRLALREDLTPNLLSRLERGELDFALIALPYDTGRLLVEPLFDDELWLVARREDPQLSARELRMSATLADRLLLLEEGHCLRDHVLAACPHDPRGKRNEMVTATSLLTLVQMIESGLGVGLLPAMAVRAGLVASPALLARPLTPASPTRTVAIVARASSARSAEFHALASLLRALADRAEMGIRLAAAD